MSLARNIVINSQPNASIQAYTGSPTSFTINANSNKALYYNVTNNANTEYAFSGDVTGNNPTIDVLLGDSLTFYVNASGHPFYIKTVNSTGSSNAVSSAQIFGPAQITVTGGTYAGVYTRVATEYNWNTSNSTIVTGNNRDAYFNALTGVAILYDNTTNWYIATGVELINGTDLVPTNTFQTTWGLAQSGTIDYPNSTVDPTYGSVAFYSSSGNGTAVGSFTWTPLSVGTYYYNCSNHAAMYGVINVLTPPTITYVWQKQESGSGVWNNIVAGTGTGQGTPTYQTPILDETADNGDKYRCQLSAPLGTNSPLNSNTYTLTVTTPVITINTQPSNITLGAGLYANFSVAATVSSPFAITYQWQLRKSGSATWDNIAGATANTLSVPNLDNGDLLRCVLNSTGAQQVTSSQATITIIPYDITPSVGNTGLPNPQVSSFTTVSGYTSFLYTSDPALTDGPDNYTLLNPVVWDYTNSIQQASSIYAITPLWAAPAPTAYSITSFTKNYYPCPECPPCPPSGGGSNRPTEGLIVPRHGL